MYVFPEPEYRCDVCCTTDGALSICELLQLGH
jgi:hypothetical protein